MNNFSVLMSVYKNTKLSELKECLESLYAQTVCSDDIVVVIDGAVTNELTAFLYEEKEKRSELNIYPLEQNAGLGRALRYGIGQCKNELIARMDTDDICVSERFERQLSCFADDPGLSIAGSSISEFMGEKDKVVFYRDVPLTHEEICRFMKKRSPFNHMTVMYKKSAVTKAGSYPEESCFNEDYYLWINMFLSGAKFKNLPERLVYARIDENTFLRRGGCKYYKGQKKLFRYMRKNKMIGFFAFQKAKIVRFVVQVLMPNRMRKRFYEKAVRKTK